MILPILRNTWPVFLGIAFLQLGSGLQGTLTGWRATYEGFTAITTGWIMTSYYVGFMAGSIFSPFLVRGVGHVRVFAALASLASSAVLIQILLVSPPVWLAMRLISGFCFAGVFVVVESWLNARSDNITRGRILSFYMLIAYLAMAGGQWLLKLADPTGMILFIVSSILLSLALIPVLISRIHAPEIEIHQEVGVFRLISLSPAGALTIVFSSMATGAMFGMGAVYAIKAGMDLAQTALFMSVFILLGSIAQWPIGWLSDRFDRRRVILLSSLLAGIACLLMTGLMIDLPIAVFYTLWGLVGAMTLPMYSLAVAHTNDRLLPEQMIGASSSIVMLFGAGSVLGPIAAGYLLDHFGLEGFFVHLTLTHLLISGSVFYFMLQKPPVAEEQTTSFHSVPPRPTLVTMEALAQEAEESQTHEQELKSAL